MEKESAEMEKKMLFLSPLEAEMYERTNESNDPDDIWSGRDLLEYQEEIRNVNLYLKSSGCCSRAWRSCRIWSRKPEIFWSRWIA